MYRILNHSSLPDKNIYGGRETGIEQVGLGGLISFISIGVCIIYAPNAAIKKSAAGSYNYFYAGKNSRARNVLPSAGDGDGDGSSLRAIARPYNVIDHVRVLRP